MKLLRIFTFAAFVFTLAFGALAAPANAATVEECQAQITSLRQATANATFVGQQAEKNQNGLLGKLAAASADLTIGKNADAIQKLTDFRTKVEQLNTQGKIAPADAATLIAGSDNAILCIQSIGTTP